MSLRTDPYPDLPFSWKRSSRSVPLDPPRTTELRGEIRGGSGCEVRGLVPEGRIVSGHARPTRPTRGWQPPCTGRVPWLP